MSSARQQLIRSFRIATLAGIAVLVFASVIGAAAFTLTTDAHASQDAAQAAISPPSDPLITQAPADALASDAMASVVTDAPVGPSFAETVSAAAARAQQLLAEVPIASDSASLQAAPPAAPAPDIALAAPVPDPVVRAARVPEAALPVVGTLYDIVAAAFPENPEVAYRIMICESSGRPAARAANGHYGLWQFDTATWRRVGGTGLPSEASAEEQTARARMLYDARGWQPWECK